MLGLPRYQIEARLAVAISVFKLRLRTAAAQTWTSQGDKVKKLFAFHIAFLIAGATAIPAQNRNPHVAPLSVEQILDRHEEAVGGREALERIRSLHEVDVIQIPKTGQTEIADLWVVPGKCYSASHVKERRETFKAGYDGETGWSIDPRVGFKELSGQDLANARRVALFPEEIRLRELVSQMHVKGKARVGEHEAYIVEIQFEAGYLSRMYFDSKTWLKVREDVLLTTSPDSPITEIYFDDFREIPDVKIKYAFRRVEKANKHTVVVHVKELHFNVPVEESLFKPPSSTLHIQR